MTDSIDKITIARRKALYFTGYQHGVSDQNRNQSITATKEEFGSMYLEGYAKGFADAEKRNWYIVAIDKHGKTTDWFTEGNWVKAKEEALIFKTEQEARQRCNELTNTVGRGNYSVIWR